MAGGGSFNLGQRDDDEVPAAGADLQLRIKPSWLRVHDAVIVVGVT